MTFFYLRNIGFVRRWALDQRIDTTFLSLLSLIADIERLPVAASWMCSLHHFIIGRLRSM